MTEALYLDQSNQRVGTRHGGSLQAAEKKKEETPPFSEGFLSEMRFKCRLINIDLFLRTLLFPAWKPKTCLTLFFAGYVAAVNKLSKRVCFRRRRSGSSRASSLFFLFLFFPLVHVSHQPRAALSDCG